jgi:hypothetical protein
LGGICTEFLTKLTTDGKELSQKSGVTAPVLFQTGLGWVEMVWNRYASGFALRQARFGCLRSIRSIIQESRSQN